MRKLFFPAQKLVDSSAHAGSNFTKSKSLQRLMEGKVEAAADASVRELCLTMLTNRLLDACLGQLEGERWMCGSLPLNELTESKDTFWTKSDIVPDCSG